MPFHCPACNRILSTEGSIPKFCSHCGHSLEGSLDDQGELTEVRVDITKAMSKRVPGRTERTAGPVDTLGQDSTDQGGGQRSTAVSVGSFVGPFEINAELGRGGMGTVYRATHSQSGQTVALKLLSRSVRASEETIQRFQRESQIAASINHPRSTFIYQAGQHGGQFYITMELMNGGTLADVVEKEGSIPVGRAIDYILDIISGLQAAHQVGIVHRDLKPSNCFMDHQGHVKVGDFGLAKSLVSDASLTQTGTFMGTPQYAAPEQLRASDVDERADIYAIGGTLFFLLTGRAPFVGNAAQVIVSIASETPPKVNTLASHIPNKLTQAVHQTLEKDPGRRPENLETLRQMLLPFSTRGATTADLGRRLAAFFIDLVLVGICIVVIAQIAGIFAQTIRTDSRFVFLINLVVSYLVSTFYFSVQECRWGTTFGKWLFGMRVITSRNQHSGIFPSVLRASLVPGLMYLTNSLPAYFLDLLNPEKFELLDQAIWVIITAQLAQFLSWIPVMLCFLTARKENGYRGFHEVISGTRVVRLAGALESLRPQHAAVTVPLRLETTEQFGDFQAIGELGRRALSPTTLLLGRDTALERDVWILKRDLSAENKDPSRLISENRKSVSRPTRLRVMAESNEAGQEWAVMEAVKGMPLVDFIEHTGDIDWRSFRPVLRDLAYELAKSENDNTMPVHLSPASVWIDQQGRAKLLDEAIVPVNRSEFPPTTSTNGGEKSKTPFELLTGLLDTFIENQVVPAHVLTFRRELETLRGNQNVLDQIGERLGELADIPSAWRWDDRLGALAITFGIEFSTAMSAYVICLLVAAFLLNMSLLPISVFVFVLASLVATGLGGILSGGPAFRLSGVLVRKNKTLEPASRFRCAFRNWVAWLPMIMGGVCVAVITQQAALLSQENSELEQNIPIVIVAALIGLLLIFMTIIVGAVYSIIRPSRGLPDVVAGTRLIRK